MEIQDIFVIYDTLPETKSSGQSDTLLYLINFSEDSGYAVLAADNRIPEGILMISENGSATPEMFYEIFPSYPYDTTFNYYNSQYDDYYIGGEVEHPEEFILQMVHEYASNAQEKGKYGEYSNPDDSLRLIDGTALDTYPIPINVEEYTTTNVEVMLKTRWHQEDPYNCMVPNGKPAGCVPIAIAQIMAFNEYPKNLTINDIYIDWESLNSTPYVESGTLSANMVGVLIRDIQIYCSSFTTRNWTFTLPIMAKEYLSHYGYQDVKLTRSYDESLLFSSLTSGTPVFLAGAQNHIFWKSHGWVIDGWKSVYEKFDMIDKYTGNYLYSDHRFKYDLIHCNWGNNSIAWVTSGVFNDGSYTYNTFFRMITYTKPQ